MRCGGVNTDGGRRLGIMSTAPTRGIRTAASSTAVPPSKKRRRRRRRLQQQQHPPITRRWSLIRSTRGIHGPVALPENPRTQICSKCIPPPRGPGGALMRRPFIHHHIWTSVLTNMAFHPIRPTAPTRTIHRRRVVSMRWIPFPHRTPP